MCLIWNEQGTSHTQTDLRKQFSFNDIGNKIFNENNNTLLLCFCQ